MRKKSVKPGLLLAMGLSVATFVSCTHGENVYDNEAYFQNQAQQYAMKWQEKFGPVDPEQNWNMATQAKANIAVPSGSTVNVYTGNPYLNQGILLASFTNSGEYTFDAPKGRNLYFQAVDANGKTDVRTMTYNESNTYNVDFAGNAMAKTKSLGVRSGSRSCTEFAEVKRSTPYATGLWAYISEWYNGASLWDDATTIKKYNNWGDKYYYVADNAQGNGAYVDKAVMDAITEIIPENQKSSYYDKIIQDVDLIVEKTGPVTLTCASATTSNAAAIGYYIYTDKKVDNTDMACPNWLTAEWLMSNGNTDGGHPYIIEQRTGVTDAQKLADKFVIIPNVQNQNIKPETIYEEQSAANNWTWGIVKGYNCKTIKLLYKNPTTGEVSENFPAGTKISFFIVPNANCSSASYIDAQRTVFSFADMNVDAHRTNVDYSYYSGFSESTYATSHAATFKVKDKIVIGFEDANAYNSNDFDYNDCVFILDGNFKEEVIPDPIPVPDPDPDPVPESTPQWIIACEDLGSTEDYDFNDIVFGVTHKAGETTATITPLAAGGVYRAEIYYYDKLIGEIHELLGHSVKEDGKYPMINTGGTTDNGKTVQTINVPSDFTISEGMGGFNIKVTIPQEGEEATGLGGQAVRIWGTQIGNAPQMFMLEGTWKWPKEKQNIENAYPNFAKWNNNHQNYDWVNDSNSGLVWEPK